MITHLRLTNFRRHENTVIDLTEGEQTIVVSGRNGAGKSSIIEAIVYALVGESRHGRYNLERLVRRGAEIEGMEVEMAFKIEGGEYRIVRRRDGRTASAVLSVNGTPTVEGSRQVTAAIEDVLGMDAQGIRLAVVAQQKELDLLVRMGGAARSRAIGRLLRLDAIARARDEARQAWRVASSALDAMPETGDLVALAGEVARSEQQLAQAAAAESQCRSEIAVLEAELAASSHVEQDYTRQREEIASRNGEIAALAAETARLRAQLASLEIPEEVPVVVSPAVLERQAAELEHTIAQAEASRRVAEQRRVIEQERERGEARIAEISAVLAEGDAATFLAKSEEVRAQASALRADANVAAARREELREDLGRIRSEMEHARASLDAVRTLGAVCDTCGQEIGDEHRESHEAKLLAAIAQAEERMQSVIAEGQAVKARWEEAEAAGRSKEEEANNLQRRAEQAAALEGEQSEIARRVATYTSQLGRLSDGEADLDELYARKGEITIAVMESRHAAEQHRLREDAIERRAKLEILVEEAASRLASAEASRRAVEITAELEQAWQHRSEVLDRQRSEMLMLTALVGETATCREQLAAQQAALRHANEMAASRRRQQNRGRDAANAQKLLADVEQTIGGAIRPSLESTVSDILVQMSQGRFTSVKVNAEYDVTVLDDGAYRPLSELSGGEADLVALAVRLGVADVVCQRTGTIGFLILDEPFGSQDAERRESILGALRALRGRYGQIWCISHVGGLDDVADRVIEVEISDEGSSVAQ